MSNALEVQATPDFEVPSQPAEDFARTAMQSSQGGLRAQSTGMATCPAKTGQYC